MEASIQRALAEKICHFCHSWATGKSAGFAVCENHGGPEQVSCFACGAVAVSTTKRYEIAKAAHVLRPVCREHSRLDW
jgi:hypothetical protein